MVPIYFCLTYCDNIAEFEISMDIKASMTPSYRWEGTQTHEHTVLPKEQKPLQNGTKTTKKEEIPKEGTEQGQGPKKPKEEPAKTLLYWKLNFEVNSKGRSWKRTYLAAQKWTTSACYSKYLCLLECQEHALSNEDCNHSNLSKKGTSRQPMQQKCPILRYHSQSYFI